MKTPTTEPRRRLGMLIGPVLIALALALAACGGDGTDGEATPSPTPGETAASPTPPPQTAPPVTVTQTPPPEPTPTPTPQVDVSPLDPFDVRATEAINIREIPATSSDVVATLFPGETATVLGEARGEVVEPGDDAWYQVEFTREGTTVRGFLYATYVAPVS